MKIFLLIYLLVGFITTITAYIKLDERATTKDEAIFVVAFGTFVSPVFMLFGCISYIISKLNKKKRVI